MTLPLARLVVPIQDSLFPAYSRIQSDRARVARIWHRTNSITVSIVAPTMVGLSILAPEFVAVVLGERWMGTVPILRILAPVAILQSLTSLSGSLLLGIDRSTTLFRLTLTNTVLIISAFVVGLQWGIVGVAAAFAAVMIPMASSFLYVTAIALGSQPREVVRSLSGPFEATVAMAVAVLTVRWLLGPYTIPTPISLIVLVGVGVVVYIPACLLRVAPVRAELGRYRRFGHVIRVAEGTRLATSAE
jgi:O-antigen/teichoic acid export membrane protein